MKVNDIWTSQKRSNIDHDNSKNHDDDMFPHKTSPTLDDVLKQRKLLNHQLTLLMARQNKIQDELINQRKILTPQDACDINTPPESVIKVFPYPVGSGMFYMSNNEYGRKISKLFAELKSKMYDIRSKIEKIDYTNL